LEVIVLHDFVEVARDEMLTSRFIFMHFPRTGGSTLRRVLPQIVHQEISWAHAPYDFYAGLCMYLNIPIHPAFIFIRHPWSWYVSQWLWYASANGEGWSGSFRDWMEVVKSSAAGDMASFSSSFIVDKCPMTFVWRYMQGDKADYVGFYEDYENEVIRILSSILGDDMDESLIRTKIASAGRRARTTLPEGHSSYRDFYDKETRQWVLEWDAELIERFDYRWEND